MADHRHDEMSFDRAVSANLEVVHADAPFLVLEASFDTPSRECHAQQRFHRRVGGSMSEEVLGRAVEHVTRNDEAKPLRGSAIAMVEEGAALDLPDLRSLERLLEMEGDPGLFANRTAMAGDLLDGLGRRSVRGDARKRPKTLALGRRVLAVWPNLGTHRPSGDALGNLDHVEESFLLHAFEECRDHSIAFVGADPLERNAVGLSVTNLREGDLVKRTIDHLFRNAGGTASTAVEVPRVLGQVEIAIDERVEAGFVGEGEVDRDDAVVDLAGGAAILPLDARRHLALLVEAGLVDDADVFLASVLAPDDVLDLVAHGVLVPAQKAQELLKTACRDASGVSDGFDRLALERSELSFDVGLQSSASVDRVERMGKLGEEPAQPPTQALNIGASNGTPPG